MYRVILVEESPFLLSYLEKMWVVSFSDTEQALNSIDDYDPQIIILNDESKEGKLLDFCQKLRQKYSLPILLIMNFYSNYDLELFRKLKVNFIIKPFTHEELEEKIHFLMMKEKESEKHTEFIEQLKPLIKQELQSELYSILKQLLEEMEKKYA